MAHSTGIPYQLLQLSGRLGAGYQSRMILMIVGDRQELVGPGTSLVEMEGMFAIMVLMVCTSISTHRICQIRSVISARSGVLMRLAGKLRKADE
jgi:hypothetical protein